jgi:hypothetical protein
MKLFNAVVFVGDVKLGNQGFVTYHKIASVDKFKIFLWKKYPNWEFATIYNYFTQEKIEVIKSNIR